MTMRITGNQATRQVAADIRRQQEAISAVREQLSSGRRINRPSDDPAQAARLVGIDAARGRLEQYARNASAAESRLTLEEGALGSVNDTLARVRELALSASDGALGDRDRETLRLEVLERVGELYDAGNARDAAGDYLFAGSRSDAPPFERGDPAVFHGNAVARELPIGVSRTVASGDSGVATFLRVPTGNGEFTVDADAVNTGTGVIATGAVIDRTAFREADYRIEFASPTSFDVVDADSGATVIAAQPFADGASIEFEGLATSISGSPAAGDVFHVRSGERRDLFATVERLGALLGEPAATPADAARLRQGIQAAIGDIDHAMDGVNAARGRVGARLQAIDGSRVENEAIGLQLARTDSEIGDVDVADAVTRLESRAFALEVLQKSWARVENLSLFNYL